MIICKKAYQSGKGTDRWKGVFGMSETERQAARDHETVMFRSAYLSGGRWGTYWRRVDARRVLGRWLYDPRVPAAQEIAQAEILSPTEETTR